MRRRLPILAVVALLAVAAGVTVILLKEGVDRTQRGTGQGTVKPDEPGTRAVSVKRTSATAFDPAGDGEEHDDEAPLAVDKDSGTDWTTEGYRASQLGKDGVGIYVDADPGVGARSIAIDTPEPGWEAEIRVADGSSPPKDIGDWKKVAGGKVAAKRKRFRLKGDRHRYYLVWITHLAPDDERVKIAEITLFAPRA